MALSLTGLVTLGATIAASAFSMSWFTNKNYIQKDITGSVAGAYFAYGDGSKEKPFGINIPRHLYNLAWLQYMGYFNEDEDKDGTIDKQYYFEIDKSISILDMSEYVTPPIGTESYPFVGNFNGNGAVISGLTISSNQNNFTSKPNKVVENGFTAPSIIGFFGVVGKLPDSDYSFDLETNSIHDLYLDKITIQNSSSTTNILAGLLAGYVNGIINTCGVYRGKFDFVNGTTNIADSFNNVSDYSLIGSYDSNNYSWTDIPGGGGQENDFGGSIDMLSINRRLNYMRSAIKAGIVSGASMSAVYPYKYADSSVYNVCVATTDYSSEHYWNNDSITSTNRYYMYEGTYLPLNIDQVASGIKDSEGNVTTRTESTTNDGWHITDAYNGGEKEMILDTNSGYIVGGEQNVQSIFIPVGGYGNNLKGIYRSLGLNSIPTSTSDYKTFDKHQPIQCLTIDSNNETYRILDDDNKEYSYSGLSTYSTVSSNSFKRYESVINNFNSSMKDSYNVHGFHFLSAINIDSPTKSKHSATLFGQTYSSYEFVDSALNFTVKKDGYLTSLIGTYFRPTQKQTCFDLYKVTRDGSQNISLIKKIKYIYKDGSNKTVYQYHDSTFSDATITNSSNLTLVQDMEYLSSGRNLDYSCAYYFEFPVIAGDYLIGANSKSSSSGSGSVSSSNANMAYLMYLDIGANASSEKPGTEKTSIIKDIDFVLSTNNDYTGIVKLDADGYVASNVLFKISGAGNTQGIFYFMRSSSGVVLYYINAAGLSIGVISSEGSANASKSDDPPWTTA